ncbi:MAG: trypsin-like peptidase domain-containing protein [Microcystis sp. M41BS1]|nr:trypsin-like peptidase domain-containing protein [Microcystis sp. M41BS1]
MHSFVLLKVCVVVLVLNPSAQAFGFLDNKPLLMSEEKQEKFLPEEQIHDLSEQITVRVFGVDSKAWENTQSNAIKASGSGVIVDKQEVKVKKGSLFLYFVLTNNHISSQSKEFYIKTPDGLVHKAFVHPTAKFQKNNVEIDLGLLGFYTPYDYEKAVIGTSDKIEDGSKLFVTGFPCNVSSEIIDCPAKFTFQAGKVFKSPKLLKDGYQLGFTNLVSEGMSGGANLDIQGKLIGITGRRSSQVVDVPQYQYADQSVVPDIIRDNAPLALGLPIEHYSSLDREKLLRDFIKKISPLSQSFEPLYFLNKNQVKSTVLLPDESSHNSSFFLQNSLFVKVGIVITLLGSLVFCVYRFRRKKTFLAEFHIYQDQNQCSQNQWYIGQSQWCIDIKISPDNNCVQNSFNDNLSLRDFLKNGYEFTTSESYVRVCPSPQDFSNQSLNLCSIKATILYPIKQKHYSIEPEYIRGKTIFKLYKTSTKDLVIISFMYDPKGVSHLCK